MNNEINNKVPNNFVWTWNLFATAVGAGVLFLPINAGINGIWPLIVLALITLPMNHLAHKNLSRVLLASSKNSHNINNIIHEYFSPKFGHVFAFCYLLAIYPLILIYSVGLTNTLNSVLNDIIGITFIPKPLLAFLILLTFFIVLTTKTSMIRKIIEYIALPLAGSLLLLSIYLIPQWNFDYVLITPSAADFLETLWLTIPVVIFTFNYSPIVSTFSLTYLRNHPSPETETKKVLWQANILIYAFIMFFVFSCVLSVKPEQMLEAKQLNMNILVYMSRLFHDPILHTISPLIAIIAMSGAFLGSFFGAKESIVGILEQYLSKNKMINKNIESVALAAIFIPCYIFCIFDTNILNIMSVLSGPIIALLLFVFPVYAVYQIPALAKYKTDKLNNYFVLLIGLISCSAILYSFRYLILFLR
jgi:serine transporter